MVDKGSWCFGTGSVHILGVCGVVNVGGMVVGMSGCKMIVRVGV
jgi:hypothetical protein